MEETQTPEASVEETEGTEPAEDTTKAISKADENQEESKDDK